MILAALVVVVLLIGSGGYGPHRDELYFLAAGDHLAIGYPDQGPLTPAIAAVVDELSPTSLLALRLAPAFMIGAIVILTGLIARELGGGRRAELIAAGCAAVGSVFLITGHLLSTTTFDLLAWTSVSLLAIRAVRRGNDHLWIWAGLALGVGLLNKPLPAFLALGLLSGVLIAGPRELLGNRWVWLGALLALVMWAPWLIWQADHGWPQLEVADNLAAGGSASSQPRWAFLPFQLLLVSPVLAPVWLAGLWQLLRAPALERFRFLGWAWITLAMVFIVTSGKPYYLAGLFPVLLGAGAIAVDRWLNRGGTRVRTSLLALALATSAIVSVTLALPVLPTRDLGPVLAANADIGETVGWPELVRTVGEGYAASDPVATSRSSPTTTARQERSTVTGLRSGSRRRIAGTTGSGTGARHLRVPAGSSPSASRPPGSPRSRTAGPSRRSPPILGSTTRSRARRSAPAMRRLSPGR